MSKENFDYVEESPTKETIISWCNEAFLLISKSEFDTASLRDRADANIALRRMLGVYIELEEYEKCSQIKKILDQNFTFEVSPLFDY